MERGGADKTQESQGYKCVCVYVNISQITYKKSVKCMVKNTQKTLHIRCLIFAVKNMVATFYILHI